MVRLIRETFALHTVQKMELSNAFDTQDPVTLMEEAIMEWPHPAGLIDKAYHVH